MTGVSLGERDKRGGGATRSEEKRAAERRGGEQGARHGRRRVRVAVDGRSRSEKRGERGDDFEREARALVGSRLCAGIGPAHRAGQARRGEIAVVKGVEPW